MVTRTYRSIVVVVTLLLLFTLSMNAQITLQAGGGLGARVPSGDLGGSTIDFYGGTKYGLSTGYNLHAKARVGLLSFILAGEIGYGTTSNSGEALVGQGKVDVSQSIFSLKAGPEFHLGLPFIPITPYVGANVALNNISGEFTIQGVTKVPSGTYSVKSVSRVGVGVSAGTLVDIGPMMTLDINLEYTVLNFSGKMWEDVNPTKEQKLDSYLALNDDKDPLYKAGDDIHFIKDARSMNSILFTVSILFGL